MTDLIHPAYLIKALNSRLGSELLGKVKTESKSALVIKAAQVRLLNDLEHIARIGTMQTAHTMGTCSITLSDYLPKSSRDGSNASLDKAAVDVTVAIPYRGGGIDFDIPYMKDFVVTSDGKNAANTSVSQLAYTINCRIPAYSASLMIVDDEEGVLSLMCAVVQRMGYKATSFNNGVDALAYINENPKAIDLVVSDITMPTMDGLRLFSYINQSHPEMKVLLNTGYTDMVDAAGKLLDRGLLGILEKPWKFPTFYGAIQSALTMKMPVEKLENVTFGRKLIETG